MTAAQTVRSPIPVKSAICRRTATEEKASGAKHASVVTSAYVSDRLTMGSDPMVKAW